MMQEERAWQKDMTTKLKLKQAAIAALPTKELRDAALVEDLTPFPADRMVWTHTPPAPDFGQNKTETVRSARRRR
jgi:hypothetical protein